MEFERKNMIQPYIEGSKAYKKEKEELLILRRKDALVHDIFESRTSAQIIGIEMNKMNQEFYVVHSHNTISLYTYNNICFTDQPRLFYEFEKDGDSIKLKIVDIQLCSINEGNGTILMNALIKFAKEQKISEIFGKMAPCDNDHAERRAHYYEKFGFTFSDGRATLIIEV